MAFNLVILTGRLTKEPELKFGASGTAYCKFTLAVNRMKKDDPADFIFCSAFGKTAELIAEYVKKGYQLGVQGRLQQDTYEKDGEKISKTGVTVDKIEFLESNKTESTTSEPKKSNKVNPKPDLNLGEPKVEINFEDDTDPFPFN
jgi:single-strand DNA-binding protein